MLSEQFFSFTPNSNLLNKLFNLTIEYLNSDDSNVLVNGLINISDISYFYIYFVFPSCIELQVPT